MSLPRQWRHQTSSRPHVVSHSSPALGKLHLAYHPSRAMSHHDKSLASRQLHPCHVSQYHLNVNCFLGIFLQSVLKGTVLIALPVSKVFITFSVEYVRFFLYTVAFIGKAKHPHKPVLPRCDTWNVRFEATATTHSPNQIKCVHNNDIVPSVLLCI